MGLQVHQLGQKLSLFQSLRVPSGGVEQNEDCQEYDQLLRDEQAECIQLRAADLHYRPVLRRVGYGITQFHKILQQKPAMQQHATPALNSNPASNQAYNRGQQQNKAATGFILLPTYDGENVYRIGRGREIAVLVDTETDIYEQGAGSGVV